MVAQPRMGSRYYRIGLICFVAGCRKRATKPGSVLSLILVSLWVYFVFFTPVTDCIRFFILFRILSPGYPCLVVVDWLERLVCGMLSMEMLNRTRSLSLGCEEVRRWLSCTAVLLSWLRERHIPLFSCCASTWIRDCSLRSSWAFGVYILDFCCSHMYLMCVAFCVEVSELRYKIPVLCSVVFSFFFYWCTVRLTGLFCSYIELHERWMQLQNVSYQI